jgi:quercetin dioxygenase-like cupin family protein
MQEVVLPGGTRVEVHLGAADTGGLMCLLVDHPPPGWALPPHRHANEAETIHVLDGRFELVVDGERCELGPGDTAHVPRGVVHSGRNVGDGPGRRLIVFTPGGIEGWFLEVGETPESALEAALRYGWEFVGD